MPAKKIDAGNDGPRKWFEYKIEGDCFTATCSDSMRTFVLARLYEILSGDGDLAGDVVRKNYSTNLACVFRAAMNGNAEMTRAEMLLRLHRMRSVFEGGEDWYMLACIKKTICAVKEMSDPLFLIIKRRLS